MEYKPDYVVAPGATLVEWMNWSGMPRKVCQKKLELADQGFEDLLNGDLVVNKLLAQKLYVLTHINVSFWLALEHNYREGLKHGLKKL